MRNWSYTSKLYSKRSDIVHARRLVARDDYLALGADGKKGIAGVGGDVAFLKRVQVNLCMD